MKSHARLIVAIICVATTSIFFTAWSGTWLARGSYLTAIIMLGAGIMCSTTAFQAGYALSGAARPRTEHGATGTVLRPAKWLDPVSIGGFTCGVLAAGLYLVFAPQGMVDYVPRGVLRVTVPSGCIFILMFGIPVLYRMFRHGDSHLRLHPGGFELWNGHWGIFKRGEWDEIEQILDRQPRGRSIGREMIVLKLPKNRSAMLVTDTITDNSDALREWVRFYWQHPEHRDELVDNRALRRLDERRFTPG
ncbi:hypothetical protein C6A87_025700 [Mycobacterium sp. ITM-2016-00317]|uniref:hypothetical protein n=1 Tax=Mycobacterium sp. ITM-2016-00317 TaxID=2099694 RepID=UPI000D4CD90F|nr:hypothetical protein [Mycobacterium sp. ITM-2016-00317]WNG87133.1 hypothetical protein C6A87_025700 [Mycobacterium sp. ITM-2016-00317]